MNERNLIETAYGILFKKKKAIDLYKLYDEVLKKLGLSQTEGQAMFVSFYTELSVDGRFVSTGDNKWTISEYMSNNNLDIDLSDDEDDERDPDELAQEDIDEYGSEYEEKTESQENIDLSDSDDSSSIDYDESDSF